MNVRKLWYDDLIADWIREALGITDCRIAFRVDREVWRGGERESCDTRYFITSLDPEAVIPADLQSFTRGHWQVENCLHYIKDRTLNEDRHSIRRSGLGPRILKIRDAGCRCSIFFITSANPFAKSPNPSIFGRKPSYKPSAWPMMNFDIVLKVSDRVLISCRIPL